MIPNFPTTRGIINSRHLNDSVTLVFPCTDSKSPTAVVKRVLDSSRIRCTGSDLKTSSDINLYDELVSTKKHI